MTTEWRALCAELLRALEIQLDDLAPSNRLCKRARLALAQPEPVGPSNEELQKAADAMRDENDTLSLVEYARAVLQRWGHPTITPIPVSERPWERDGFCDAEGVCWFWEEGGCWWQAYAERIIASGHCPGTYSHCLPFQALPLPGQPATAAPAP